MDDMDEQPCIIEELRGLPSRDAVSICYIRERAIAEITALRLRVEALEDEVYHTKPGEMEFAPEGWTWRQQARATEARVKELEQALVSVIPSLERCGLIGASDTLINALHAAVVVRTALGGTTSVQEKARTP